MAVVYLAARLIHTGYIRVDGMLHYLRTHAAMCDLALGLAHQTNVDFAVNELPFLRLSKRSHQFFKRLGMLGGVFKPRQKVERFTNIAAMIKLPCDRRQVLYSFGDMMGFFLKNASTFLLG